MTKRAKNIKWLHIRSTGMSISGCDTALSHALKLAARKNLQQLGLDPIRTEIDMTLAAYDRRKARAKEKADRAKRVQEFVESVSTNVTA